MIYDFTLGMTPREKMQARRIIDILIRNSDINTACLVGSVALRYHLSNRRIERWQRPFRGVDVACLNPYKAIYPTILKELWLYWKNPQYIALLDAGSGANLSIYGNGIVPFEDDSILVRYDSRLIRVVKLEFMFIRLLVECCGVLEGKTVDPKQFMDLITINPILGAENASGSVLSEIWERAKGFHPSIPSNWHDAYDLVMEAMRERSNLFVPNLYRRVAKMDVGRSLAYAFALVNAPYTLSRRLNPALGW